MATVHLGRLLGPVGFSRIVAIKRLHGNLARDPEFTAMFLDEARLAARVRHPNVVATLDVVAMNGELFLVMDYVHGQSLSWALANGATSSASRIPLRVLGAVMSGVLQGLHAAHEACSDRGEPLGIVHRDVSPQNVLIGDDGTSRIVDFGVAKAVGRLHTTRGGQIKGKIEYMAPEQVLRGELTRQTDIWGASVVLWRAIAGRKLFCAPSDGQVIYQILEDEIAPPSRYAEDTSPQLDSVVLKGLERDPSLRYASALDMAIALEKAVPVASQREVAEWILSVASEELEQRAERIARIESISPDSSRSVGPTHPPIDQAPIAQTPIDQPIAQTPIAPSPSGALAGLVPNVLLSAASQFTAGSVRASQADTRPDGDAARLRPSNCAPPPRGNPAFRSVVSTAVLVITSLFVFGASTSGALPMQANDPSALAATAEHDPANASVLAPLLASSMASPAASSATTAPIAVSAPAPSSASTAAGTSVPSSAKVVGRNPHHRNGRPEAKEELYVRE